MCWRCDTELVFRLVDEWFIRMDELRDQIKEVAKKIRWIPAYGLEMNDGRSAVIRTDYNDGNHTKPIRFKSVGTFVDFSLTLAGSSYPQDIYIGSRSTQPLAVPFRLETSPGDATMHAAHNSGETAHIEPTPAVAESIPDSASSSGGTARSGGKNE